ncbi:MAG: FAD:protein FMN transferase [Candidatus Cloacimonetes bacterium]|nr:FAD:protein FMN transferase [Candidatus Cloacimonadota bacterium]
MKSRKIYQIVFIILLFAIIYIRISYDKSKPIKETRLALGTFVTIDIQDRNIRNKTIVDSSFSLIDKYEKQLSVLIPNSEITKINKSILNEIKVSDTVCELLKRSKQISELSDGAFDVTIGIILEDYDFVNHIIPTEEDIKTKIKFMNYKNLTIFENELIKKEKNIHIDLGGIAKGFIIDKVIEYLRKQNICYAAVNAGGDLYVMDNKKNEKWKIGIQHPRKEGEIFAEISIKTKAVVTSGDYEQFFFINGKRIHHILDPKTGLPADKSISATVICPDATTADALCTAIFVMGPEKGIDLVNNINEVEAMVIYEKNEKLVYKLSDGFAKYNFHHSE